MWMYLGKKNKSYFDEREMLRYEKTICPDLEDDERRREITSINFNRD